MKTEVRLLYKNGRLIHLSKPLINRIGDLNLSPWKHPIAGWSQNEASLLDTDGTPLVPNLINAQCVLISADGIRLRGFELVNGREVAQEWYCRPIK